MSTRFDMTTVTRVVVAAACALSSASCGSELLRTGRAPVILVLQTLAAASGDEPEEFATPLLSDVQTMVETQINGQTVRVPTIFNDLGRATISAELKDQSGSIIRDPGNPVTAPTPTALNQVTITRYRVNYRRADGRNTPGVDVPFAFDGATTATIPPGSSANVVFDLVRHSSKSEPPLRPLVGQGGQIFINAVAEVTFYGRDQNGNEVMVIGMIDVIFSDFGDS